MPTTAGKAMWRDRHALTALLLTAWLGAAILIGAAGYAIDYDSSIHAVMAKKIATGQGWNTIYAHEYADNTSGDLILLPAAALTWLCGNLPSVPGVSAVFINLLAFATILFYSRRVIPEPLCLAWQAGLTLWFLFFEPSWWHVLTGELCAYLVFLLACLVAVDPQVASERRRVFLLGLLCGLSFNCKVFVALPGFGAIGAVLFFGAWRCRIRDTLALAVPALLGLFAVFAVLSIVEGALYTLEPSSHSFIDSKLWRVGSVPEVLRNHSANYRNMLAPSLNPISVKVYREVLARYGMAANLATGLLALPVLLAASLLRVAPKPRVNDTVTQRLQAILALAWLLFAVQYFKVYDSPYDHHAFYTIHTLFLLTLLFLLCRLGAAGGLLAFAAMVLLPSLSGDRRAFDELAFRLSLQGERSVRAETERNYRAATNEVVAFLQGRTFDYPLATCGWFNATREVDYLLPAGNQFLNCFDEISAHYVHDANTGHYRWESPVAFTLVVNNLYWRAAKSHKPTLRRQNLLVRACGSHTLYASDYYRVLSCSYDDLKQALPDDDSNPFTPRPPEWADHAP